MNLDDVTQGFIFDASAPTSRSSAVLALAASEERIAISRDVALTLWQRMLELPNAEQFRCHRPRYGIALGCNGSYDWLATICWECNNISITQDGQDLWQTFDGESNEAQQLLADIRALTPHDDVSDFT